MDEEIRLQLRTLGTEGVTDLKKRLAELKAEGGETAAAFGRGEITLEEYNQEMKRVADSAKALETQIKRLDAAIEAENDELAEGVAAANKAAAAQDKLAVSHGKVEKSTKDMGRATLIAGQGLQDFAQGGLSSTLNQIDQLALSLGLGPGVAGVLTAVGVAAVIAGPKIAEFFKSFSGADEQVGDLAGQLETLKKRIDELEAKPLKLGVDLLALDQAKDRLDGLNRAQAELNAQQDKQNTKEAEAGKAIETAIVESETGAAGVAGKATATLNRDLLAQSPTIAKARSRIESSRETLQLPGLQPEAVQALLARIDDAEKLVERETARVKGQAGQEYGRMLDRAKKGSGLEQDAARRQLADLLRRSGEGGIAGQVDAASPQALREREAMIKRIDQENAAEQSAIEAGAREAQARADADKKAADDQRKADAAAGKAVADSFRPEHRRDLGGMPAGAAVAEGLAAPGPKGAPKANVDTDRERRDLRRDDLARQIQREDVNYTGVNFTPEQARSAADQSLKLQDQGLSVQEATEAAMNQAVTTMQQMMIQFQRQQMMMNQFGAQFGQIGQQVGMLNQETNAVGRTGLRRGGR